jgi:steroid 5-alpha reductase family enzyme
VAASGCWLSPAIAGTALLTLLFQGSVWITEKISAIKYPVYSRYQGTTSALLPMFPSKLPQKCD